MIGLNPDYFLKSFLLYQKGGCYGNVGHNSIRVQEDDNKNWQCLFVPIVCFVCSSASVVCLAVNSVRREHELDQQLLQGLAKRQSTWEAPPPKANTSSPKRLRNRQTLLGCGGFDRVSAPK